MTKFLLTIAVFAGSAKAFAPTTSVKSSTALNEFANGYVGGEGPEPIPFSSQPSSVNWDPAGFNDVSITFIRSIFFIAFSLLLLLLFFPACS